MHKFARLLNEKQQRDRIDCVGEQIYCGLSLKGPVVGSIPMFFISSAHAATVSSIVSSWIGSEHLPIRWTLVVAATAPAATIGDLRSVEERLEQLLHVAKVRVNAHIVETMQDVESFETNLKEALDKAPIIDELNIPMYFIRFPMQDDGSQRLDTAMSSIACHIRSILQCKIFVQNCAGLHELVNKKKCPSQPQSLLVHCLQGVSRSVAVVVWFVMEECASHGVKLSPKEVVEWIRRARPSACPNICFGAQLSSLERKLSK